MGRIGALLAFLYICCHFVTFVFAHFEGVLWPLFAGYSLASIINLLKLIGNMISLTIRIENQFRSLMAFAIIASFCGSVVMYLWGLRKSMRNGISATELSLGYAGVAIPGIAAATVLFGDPMMLKSMMIVVFLTASVLQLGTVTLLDFGLWPPWIPRAPAAWPWDEFGFV
jgi:hypothetical protein